MAQHIVLLRVYRGFCLRCYLRNRINYLVVGVVFRQVGAGGAGASANKAFRSAEWRLAADKLEQMMMDLSTEGGLGAGCGWNAAVFTRETSDFISVTGDTSYTKTVAN